MKHFYLSYTLLLATSSLFAQIGIGTSSPHATAKFQVDASASTNAKGFLGPRVELTSTTANAPFSVTPATGLIVYNTATAGTGSTQVTPGLYSYNGSSWERLASNPTTFVNGTDIGFPQGYMLITSPYGYSYGPLAEISLPPGRWEVTAEFTCFAEGGFNVIVFESREHTYWLSESNSYTNISPRYPLPLSSLGSGGPTADAIFPGGAATLLPVELHSGSGGTSPTRNPRQFMKFYISNASSSSKTYYLHWHESYYKLDDSLDGDTPTYKSSPAENRFYAIKIQ
jgi:hypothetical protein